MYKKTLSGLSFVILFTFSALTACDNTSPVSQKNPVGNVKNPDVKSELKQNNNLSSPINSQSSSSTTGNNISNNSDSSNLGKNGQLRDQASDANPLPTPSSSNATPVPGSVSATPSSSPVPASSMAPGTSGQLNIIINPNPPVKAGIVCPGNPDCNPV